MNDDELQIRASRFDSGRRLHSDTMSANGFGGPSQTPITTQPLDLGGKPGDSDSSRLTRRERAVLIILCLITALGTAAFMLTAADHAREAVRYNLIWFGTGERPEMPGD